LTGRLAGRAIAQSHVAAGATAPAPREDAAATPGGTWNPALTADFLKPLLATSRDGYWHFEMVHRTVVERRYECARCHSPELPFAPVVTRPQRAAQTDVCVNCH
jgi:hypothetical protein